MSVKLDGIDLNSQGDSIEPKNEAGFGNSLENETLEKLPCDPRDVAGVSIDVARVLGESNHSSIVSGLVNEGLKAEMDDVARDKSSKAVAEGVNGDFGLKEGGSGDKEGGFVGETSKNDGQLGVEAIKAGNGEVEAKIGKDRNQGLGVNVFPQQAISLVVDLNARHAADGDVMSDNNIGNKGTAFKESLTEVNLTFSVESVENASPIKEVDLSANQNFIIKDQMNNEPFEYVDRKVVKHDPLIPKCRERESQTEKEGEFYVSDLVWAKVRSHPWWPGQIFEPSAASDKAMKYFKKDSYLIAYFGDQTFAWNEASKIKPFRMYFSQMEKQSNVEAFSCAVDGALDEVSRRVETGLACQCLPEGEFAKVKSQVVVNTGIREQSSRIYGGDSFSTAASFLPSKLVNYLKCLAQAPKVGINRLEFARARAQCLAFNRWKGNYQLPILAEFNGILEFDSESPVLDEEKNYGGAMEGVSGARQDDQVKERANSAAQDGSRKRKHQSLDDQCKKKKKEYILELMPGSSSSLSNGGKEFEAKASRKTSGKLDGSQRAVVEHGEKSANTSGFGVSALSTGKFHRGRKAHEEYPPTDEMLSKLVIAAENPVERYVTLMSVASFFLEFRNSICLDRNNACKENVSLGKQKPDNSYELETTEAFKFEGVEDSYWTDRIIQSSMDGQVVFQPETQGEMDAIAAEPENENADNDHQMNATATEQEIENPFQSAGEESEYSPTALILNFTNLESVPSITNLNNIFKRYGLMNESETEILSKSKRAKVVFKRRSDAETAFSSTGKYSIFGPSLVSYRLKYLPKLRKAPTASKTKRRRKNAKPAEESAV